MAHHAPRPPSARSAPRPDDGCAAPTLVPLTTALAALAGIAVILTGGARRPTPNPRRRDRAPDRRGLEQSRTDHRTAQRHPAGPRRQAEAGRRAGQQIAPLEIQVDLAMGQVGGARRRAYKGEHLSTVNALLGSCSPGGCRGNPELLDRSPTASSRRCRPVAKLRDQLAAREDAAGRDGRPAEPHRGPARGEEEADQRRDRPGCRSSGCRSTATAAAGRASRALPVPATPGGPAGRASSSPARRSASPTSGAPPARLTTAPA